MKDKFVQQTTVIGGEDGPVSIFIAGKDDNFKLSLKDRFRNKRYQMRCKRAKKRIRPEAHTKEETVTYANEKYGLLPVDETQLKYKNEKKGVREGIVYKHRPELLGEFFNMATPDVSDKKSMQEFRKLLQERERKMDAISDEEVPMDFRLYELVMEEGHLEMILDFRWDIFAVSYGGNRKQMRKLRRIALDLYSYYGVTADDIINKTERYSALVCALSEF